MVSLKMLCVCVNICLCKHPPQTSHLPAGCPSVMDSPLKMCGYFLVCWVCVQGFGSRELQEWFLERLMEAFPVSIGANASQLWDRPKADLTRDSITGIPDLGGGRKKPYSSKWKMRVRI